MNKIIGYLLLIASVSLTTHAQKPNILLIQVDDMGYDDLSINGNPLSKTPNLDKLAKESVRFDNFVVHSVCAPTRASLLTGRDHWRTGVSAMHGGNDYLHLDENTFGNVFQDNGYATGMWGKWHSGKSDGYWPWDRGFDEAYFARLYKYFPSTGWHNEYPKKTIHKNKWSPTALADYTIDFIDRNKEQPFLAYLSFLTCHDFWKAPEEYKKKYLDAGRTEGYATLLGMLEFMDKEVGRVLTYLKDNGLDKNTIVLFMSDNGPNLGDTNSEEWALRNNHGFVGSKSYLWQNGIKSPLYIRWRGKYKPADVERLASITDIFPTLLDMAGLSLPEDNLPLDGRSITSYLEGDTKSLKEKEVFTSNWFPVWEQDQFSPIQLEEKASFKYEKQRVTLINERYKLILNPRKVKQKSINIPPKLYNKYALFDVKASAIESQNIAQQKPEILKTMSAKMEQWFEQIKSEEHSFSPPVFQIAWKDKKESEIIAFGAAKTFGVKNGSHKISGFDKVGDYSEYKIFVHQEGNYKVTVASNKAITNISLKISCNKEHTEAKLQGREINMGSIHLEKGEHTLKVEVTETQDTDNTKNHLTKIFLKHP